MNSMTINFIHLNGIKEQVKENNYLIVYMHFIIFYVLIGIKCIEMYKQYKSHDVLIFKVYFSQCYSFSP